MLKPDFFHSDGKKMNRSIVRYMLLATLLILFILNFNRMGSILFLLCSIATPLVAGGATAYVLNIIVRYLDSVLFPRSTAPLIQKLRRPLCVILAAALVVGVIILIINMIIPGLSEAISLISRELPKYVDQLRVWLENNSEMTILGSSLSDLKLDWDSIQKGLTSLMGNGLSGVLSSTFSVVGSVTNGIFNGFIAIMFALLLLLSKDKLLSQVKRVARVYVKPAPRAYTHHALNVADRVFSAFIIGQFLNSLILGVLCTLGMTAFGMPYALIVGVISGTAALLPIIGGYIGAIVGAFLVFTVSASQALWFLLFIVVLQQIQGYLIYPRLVGYSMGMPGLWVLVAVTIGGGLGGVPGMLLGVPLAATFYSLFQERVRKKCRETDEQLQAQTVSDDTADTDDGNRPM